MVDEVVEMLTTCPRPPSSIAAMIRCVIRKKPVRLTRHGQRSRPCGVVGERLADEHARVVDQGVDPPEPLQCSLDDLVGGGGLRDVAVDGEHVRVLRRLDRAGVGHDRPAPPAVPGDQAGADPLRGAGDDGDPLAGSGHEVLSAGSLGCGLSGVVSTVIHGSRGSDFNIACISAGFPAFHRPSARDGPGSRHSRSRCPCPASSFARSASRASVSSTTWPGVPSGMTVVKVVRNSVAPFLAGRPGRSGAARAA